MTKINCHLVAINQGAAASDPLPGLKNLIEAHFAAASNGQIDMQCSAPVAFPGALPSNRNVNALDLHSWLLNFAASPTSNPSSDVYVLLASSYAPSSDMTLANAFGMMFDRGLANGEDDGLNQVYLQRPRLGCALFCNTIAAQRAGDDYHQEVAYTAIHELGHIFNLQHDQTQPNFMQSSSGSVYGPSSWHFDPRDQVRLAMCGIDPAVTPGCSPFGVGSAADRPRLDRRRKPVMALDIKASAKVVRRFDPLQIQITVRPDANEEKPIDIPDQVDPGSEDFRIFVETPHGERSVYRPPQRTCGPEGSRTISHNRPFSRDVAIFAGADGYTFKQTGPHRIWIEWTLSGRQVRSNKIEVLVRPTSFDSDADKAALRVMTDPGVARLLYYRADEGSYIAARKLSRFIEAFPATPMYAEILYSLGRCALRRAYVRDEPSYVGDAVRFLSRAAEHQNLLPHQQARAAELLHLHSA